MRIIAIGSLSRASNVRSTDKSRCYKCGGLGHLSTFFIGKEKHSCPTGFALPKDIAREILDEIVYPHIESAKDARVKVNAARKTKNSAREVDESDDSSNDEPEADAIFESSDDEDKLFAQF